MPTTPPDAIKTYQPTDYLGRFTPASAVIQPLLTAGSAQFFIVPVEQLYPLFTGPVPPVRATGHTLLYLTSGTARMHIGNEAHTIGPQEVLLVRAGQVHSFAPGDQNTGLLCHFHDDLFVGQAAEAGALATFSFLQFWGRPVISLAAQTAPFAEQLLRRLLAEYEANQLGYPAILRAYLLALLHELNRAYDAVVPEAATAAVTITNQFKQLVATHLRETHRVSDYAARLCVSTNHLSKCVRRVTGQSPARWLEESLVLEAKVLLFQSTWSVGEIAEAVGVGDASYFSRLFKKHTGATPLAFRKRNGLS